MKKDKTTIILSIILLILIIVIVLLMVSIKNKSIFKKPEFDINAVDIIPKNIDYKGKVFNVTDNYSIYIEPEPIIENNNIILNLISLDTNNILVKVRILNKGNVVAETGLISPGQYLEKVELKKKLNVGDEIVYMVMGYEKDTYYSAGSVKLNTMIGE